MQESKSVQHHHTILVVEDDIALADALVIFLGRRGYETRSACPFHMRHLQPSPDLILLDLHLRDQDGRIICKSLKNRPEHRHIPIVMMSASPQVRYSCLGAGADGFIAKPFRMVEVLEAVQLALVWK